jgi:hypothetical protein
MLPGAVPRVVGWIVLGLLLGYGLSGIVPCMPRGLAARCGVFGGILAFLGFHAFVIGGDGPSRIAAAMLLGALIGWAVSVVLPEHRPEPPEPRRLAAFSARAHRLTPTGVLTRHASGHLSARPLSLSGTAVSPTRDGAAPFTDD